MPFDSHPYSTTTTTHFNPQIHYVILLIRCVVLSENYLRKVIITSSSSVPLLRTLLSFHFQLFSSSTTFLFLPIILHLFARDIPRSTQQIFNKRFRENLINAPNPIVHFVSQLNIIIRVIFPSYYINNKKKEKEQLSKEQT
ncbi:hypothetical protein SNEBB_010772 [Seison nebaliae]|nr:hypothetical protein SNEBB_010772 [Seison nebaliae]